jgi:glycerol uptake facilitator-like aquaporin
MVCSGIAAARLSPGDVGHQLLENALATAAGLAVIILLVGPVSGAHINPVVSIADWWIGRRRGSGLRPAHVGAYIGAAYWFTASTSFANPPSPSDECSATSLRAAPGSVPPFIAAQLVGAKMGVLLVLCRIRKCGWKQPTRLYQPTSAMPRTCLTVPEPKKKVSIASKSPT